MRRLSQHEIGWLTGIIDGEGCIGIKDQTKGAGKVATIKVNMSDFDVIDRLHAVTGVGTTHHMSVPEGHRPQKAWVVQDCVGVAHILCTIVSNPLLSERRRQAALMAIDEALPIIRRINARQKVQAERRAKVSWNDECLHGHRLSEDTITVNNNMVVTCKACDADRVGRYRTKKKRTATV